MFPATRSLCASCSTAASSRHSASPPSFLTLLNQFNVEHVGAIEEKVVELGLNEVWQSSLICFLCITTIELFFFPFFLFLFSIFDFGER